ncbi:MAG: hypothetical protein U0326_27025 [Polyangiales bacterium]
MSETPDAPLDVSEHILAVRRGPGANCSSIGSAVEMLFLSAAAGVAIVAAVSAALKPSYDDDTPEATQSDAPASDAKTPPNDAPASDAKTPPSDAPTETP